MTKQRQIALLSFLLCLLFVIGTTHITFNVSAVGEVPITLEPTLEAQLAATHAVQEAIWGAKYAERTIFDFRVAYLINEEAAESQKVVSTENMYDMLGAFPVYSWDEFIKLNEQKPVHMVLIHSSIVDEVDKEWTRLAHRNGIIIVGISMRERHLIDIIGDHCRGVKPKELLDYAEDTYLLFTHYVELEDESQRDYVNESVLENCTDDFIGRGRIIIESGKHQVMLYHKEGLVDLVNTLIAITVNRGIPKPDSFN